LYDRLGSYDMLWYSTIALGVVAAVLNLPIREVAIERASRPVPA
jgi:hypothetical protein